MGIEARQAADRQRIYTAIIQRLYGDLILSRQDWPVEPVVGELVLSSTRSLVRVPWDRFMIGFLVQTTSEGYVIRDVASSDQCRVGNDMVRAIRNIHPELLLAGHQYVAAQRAQGALRLARRRGVVDTYTARWAGIEFADRDTRDGVFRLRPSGMFRPRLPDGLNRNAMEVVVELKAVPIHASSALRTARLVEDIREALTTPWSYWAAPKAHVRTDCGYRTDHHAPGSLAGAVRVGA